MKTPQHDNTRSRSIGSWVPWELVEHLCRTVLRRASQWQVLIAVALTQQRYGGNDARLTQGQLARMTGLSVSTVKRGTRALIELGLVIRTKRCAALRVGFDGKGHIARNAGGKCARQPRGARPKRFELRAAIKRRDSPVWFERIEGPFSAKQRQLMSDVFYEASELTSTDPGELELSVAGTLKLGLNKSVTFRDVIPLIQNRRMARDFIGIVLSLRRDDRVQGQELKL